MPSMRWIAPCAFSAALPKQNPGVPDSRAITFRIGVNVGDVIIDGDDLYGDGVNVAARLEKLADPGGICISGMVFDQVKGKLDAGFEDFGTHHVRNIADPLRTYRVASASVSSRSTSHVAAPAKPSIVVLPFDNMSDDHAQEYFSDGISEDLTTALSRFAWLFVIARNSAFTYKGKAVDVKQVGRELGVRYVLEGSVRRAGDRVRVTAQLIDAELGRHVWAQRYDRRMVTSLNCRTISLRASRRWLARKSLSPRSNGHAGNVQTISMRGITICALLPPIIG